MIFICRLNKDIYKCITQNIIKEEVIITEERIEHIKDRHPNDFERFYSFLSEIITAPDYILEGTNNKTGILLKDIEGEKFKLVIHLVNESEPSEYKNSVISFWHIGETTWNKNLRNKKILYSKD